MATSMSWLVLIIAGLFEVGWAIGLKYTQGFTRLWPSVGTIGYGGQHCHAGESASIVRLGCVGFIVLGIIGLKLAA